MYSKIAMNLLANPNLRYSGAIVTAVTCPCHSLSLPSALPIEISSIVGVYWNGRKLPKMYPMISFCGDSATIHNSGHNAIYCM